MRPNGVILTKGYLDFVHFLSGSIELFSLSQARKHLNVFFRREFFNITQCAMMPENVALSLMRRLNTL